MATTYNTRIVTDGLLLCLDAANPRSYPGSGTTWTDISGNNNHGTLTNGPVYNAANKGYIAFDGADDYIIVSNPATLNPGANSFTVNAWMRQKGTGYNGIVEARGDGLHGFLIILNYPSLGYLSVFVNTTTAAEQDVYYSSVATFSALNTWMNICTVINRSTEKIDYYLNGVKQGASSNITSGGTINPGSGYRYWVAADLGGPESNADVAIIHHYDRALSTTEVMQNFNASRSRYGL